jgi:antitoxin VapB
MVYIIGIYLVHLETPVGFSEAPWRLLMVPVIAKIFMNGRSQAIRLPREFRFDTSEVYITREDDRIVIYPKPKQFSSRNEVDEFFNSIHYPGFELELDNEPPQKRDLF